MLHEKLFSFPWIDQAGFQPLFDPLRPRPHRVHYKLDGLLFDVRERRPIQISDHVRGNAKNAGDLRHLELASLQKLRRIRRDADGLDRHPLFQNGHPVGVLQALMPRLPRLPQPPVGIVAQHTRMLQHHARPRPVPEEAGPELLRRQAEADRFSGRHLNRGVAHNAIMRQPS